MKAILLVFLAFLAVSQCQNMRKQMQEINQEVIDKMTTTTEVIIEDGDEIIIIDETTETTEIVKKPAFPKKVLGGYLCHGEGITAQMIADAGFNIVFVSFYDFITKDGKVVIADNRCCHPEAQFEAARGLIERGIPVLISIGGDGCQGAQPSDISSYSNAQIVAGFEEFRARTGINWSGIDFDWEQSNSDATSNAINQIGRALRPAGYYVTAVPMSSQFVPGGLQGWKTLDPDAIDGVTIQWYQGGCVGTQSCPCWGAHPVFDATCPGFSQSYMQQARKCGTLQWIEGFQKVGQYSWPADKIIIGAKSWCGGDLPSPCTASDTGIWGYEQMAEILNESGALGTAMWDIDDYFIEGYFAAGNPLSDWCKWNNQLAERLGLPHKKVDEHHNAPAYCANYEGPYATNCYPNPW